MQVDSATINTRKKHLEKAKKELKQYFIGIDGIIDDLMNYIQVWYLMPELLSRPVIINLWGMTGVGKTDLIRRLVKSLNFQDRFLEIELSNIDQTSYQTSVSSLLSANDMNDDKPSIVLFDEIQRFNTLDADGKPMPQTKFTDFWELLSDGKLSKKSKDNIDYYLMSFMHNGKDIQKRKLAGEQGIDENPVMNYWDAESLKKMLGLDKTVEELSELTQKEMVQILIKEKQKKKIYEPIDHSKTLIIVSGNLDDAFSVATQTSETDVDADIFYNLTTKINLVDIKNALTKKFRPEQVARFGNIHLIYTSLRKVDFEVLINREISRIIFNIQDKYGVTLKIDQSINQLVYRNGVFPVQGVRPVFSSIIDILESHLSKYLFTAVMGKFKTIQIAYNATNKKIIATVGSKKITTNYVGRIDKIRQNNLVDTIANISVHEAGHAVAYIILFKLAPLQLKSKIASSYAGGFTFPHAIHETKENILRKIKIYLAGGIAEELIFGKDNASIGRSGDRAEVTVLAIDFVRRYGFDTEFQANYTLELGYAMDKFTTDTDVEKMISQLVSETYQLLAQHKSLLMAISKKLMASGSLTSIEVATIAKAMKYEVNVQAEGYLEIPNYQKQIEGLN
jgi:Peptidase family M41/ATPase family associated with various cellular activities (AAA)